MAQRNLTLIRTAKETSTGGGSLEIRDESGKVLPYVVTGGASAGFFYVQLPPDSDGTVKPAVPCLYAANVGDVVANHLAANDPTIGTGPEADAVVLRHRGKANVYRVHAGKATPEGDAAALVGRSIGGTIKTPKAEPVDAKQQPEPDPTTPEGWEALGMAQLTRAERHPEGSPVYRSLFKLAEASLARAEELRLATSNPDNDPAPDADSNA